MLEIREEKGQLKLFMKATVMKGITAFKAEPKLLFEYVYERFNLILDKDFWINKTYEKVTFTMLWRLAVDRITMPRYLKFAGIEISIYFGDEHYGCIIEESASSWTNYYSFDDYCETFAKVLKDSSSSFIISNRPFEFVCPDNSIGINGKTKIIQTKTLKIKDIIYDFHIKSLEVLEIKHLNERINFSFNFPEELKIPCEQYLLYFAQFLQDLGINATSNLKEEAGKVLFSVTPTDDQEALGKIREALAVYLNLPSSPIVYDESFAAMRLKAEIERFHHSQRMTQLELQSTGYALKLAHKSIEDLQMLNQLQKEHIERISSPTIIKDSLENKEDYEKIFEGLEFGESKELKEKLGIKFNPATAIKTIVRKLSGGDDEIISLKIND
jgi:hypothetical protein